MSKKTVIKKAGTKKTAATKIKARKTESTTVSDPEEKILQSLFAVSEHWMSDLKFFNDELRFLRSLIDKYFIWLIEERNIESTRLVASGLVRLEKQRLALEQKNAEHLRHLANLIQGPFSHNAQNYKAEHGELEKSVADYVKDFRTVKKEVFKVTEYVIDSEKARHLLGRTLAG